MSAHSSVLGTVPNPAGKSEVVTLPGVLLVLGGTLVGAYVGLKIGGPTGSAVGALVGAFVGALAAGYVKEFKVVLHPDGKVEVKYTTRF